MLDAVGAAEGQPIAMGAHHLRRLFLLRSPWAPGLRLVGGEVRAPAGGSRPPGDTVMSLIGSGLRIEQAFAACVGEGIERLSQVERPGDVAKASSWREVAGDILPGLVVLLEVAQNQHASMLDWVEGVRLLDGATTLVPADWCLRRPPSQATLEPRTALSTGTAAGPTYETAAARALLELAERHAAFVWWEAGRQGAPLPLERPSMSGVSGLIAAIRRSQEERTTWLLDITTDLAIPTVAAVSFDQNGEGFAYGTAARLMLVDAAQAAVREMCQMELGLLIALRKETETGPASLNEVDLDHLSRARELSAGNCALVHPAGRPLRHVEHSSTDDLGLVSALLMERGVDASLIDMTRTDYRLPTVHALAPALCPLPSYLPTAEMRVFTERFGGGNRWTKSIPLF